MDPKENDQQQPENENANGGGSGDGQKPTNQNTFTQEQLDAILKDRLERATKKTRDEILGELGIEDLETAKQTMTEAQKAREAQMSELEKANARIEKLEAQAQAAQHEAEATRAAANEALLRAAVISKAGQFNDPEDAWKFVDTSEIEQLEDNTFKGVEEALSKLAESKPYLVKADQSNSQQQATNGTPARKRMRTVAERLLEERDNSRPQTTDELRPKINF